MKIPLQEWAAIHYNPAPSAHVLRRWARDGEITPAPERVGKEWYVSQTATRGEVVRSLSLVERLRAEA